MNTYKRVLGNISYLTIARIITSILGVIYTVYVARYLGVESYGILSFGLALTSIFNIFINFGFDPFLIREIARNKKSAVKLCSNVIILKLILGLATFFMIFLVTILSAYSEITKIVVYILTLSSILGGINTIFIDVYKSFEKMEFVALSQVIQKIISILIMELGIILQLNVVHFALIYLYTNIIMIPFNMYITHSKFVKLKIKVCLNLWKTIFKESVFFALTTIFVSIYYWMDSIMLFYLDGAFVVGLYNAAYRIILVTLIVPNVLNNVFYPLMSRYWIKDKVKFYNIFINFFSLMLPFAVILGVGTIIFSKEIILLFFGKKYIISANILRILVWSSVIAYLDVPYASLFQSSNNQKIQTKITGIGAIANMILNFILIPYLSAYGAAIATVLTELFVFILCILYGKRLYNILPYFNFKVFTYIKKIFS